MSDEEISFSIHYRNCAIQSIGSKRFSLRPNLNKAEYDTKNKCHVITLEAPPKEVIKWLIPGYLKVNIAPSQVTYKQFHVDKFEGKIKIWHANDRFSAWAYLMIDIESIPKELWFNFMERVDIVKYFHIQQLLAYKESIAEDLLASTHGEFMLLQPPI